MQQQPQPQQVQLLPQPQIQPTPQFANIQQQTAPGTIQIPAGNMQTVTNMGRPRKVVPDVANVFPQSPNEQSQQLEQTQGQQQVFPSSEGFEDQSRSVPEELQPVEPGPGFSVTEDEPAEEDLQAVTPMVDDDVETIDGRTHEPSSSSPPPEEDEQQADFEPAPSSSGSSDGFSEPGTPASMINISLAAEDNDGSGMREPGPFTAIYRPDDKGAWREKLRVAHEEELQRQQQRQQDQQTQGLRI